MSGSERRWMSGRTFAVLKNLRLTAWVIGLLILLYFLGLVLPQKWMFDSRRHYEDWLSGNAFYRLMDYIGFTSIYSSPVTIALLVVFFLNLVVVVANRAPVMLRRAYIGASPALSPESIEPEAITLEVPVDEASSARTVRETVLAQGFSIIEGGAAVNGGGGADVFLAIKNRYSPLGFLFFHMSFLLCLLGALMIFYTRFSGDLTLTEGQTFAGDMAQFHRINSTPRIMEKLPALGLQVLGVNPVYESDVPSRLEASVKVLYDGREAEEAMDVNQPLRRGPLAVLVKNIGISPLFQVLGPSGQEIDAAYVSLNVLRGRLDSFRMSDESYEFIVRFYPDYEIADGLEGTRSTEIRNPAFNIQIRRDGAVVYDGTIKPGEEAPFRHFRLKVLDIRYWVEFAVVREYGRAPLLAGFALAALGLIMRLVFYQKKMRVLVRRAGAGSIIYINARSEYFPISFGEEVGAMVDRLRVRLKEGGQ